MAQVVAYKLNSSEEIIGKLKDENDLSIVLDDARILIVSPGQGGQAQVALLPYMMADNGEGSVEIYKTALAGKLQKSIHKQLEDMYLQQTSGIQLATAGSVPPSPPTK